VQPGGLWERQTPVFDFLCLSHYLGMWKISRLLQHFTAHIEVYSPFGACDSNHHSISGCTLLGLSSQNEIGHLIWWAGTREVDRSRLEASAMNTQ
jgi:hypothetical protein